MFGPTLLWKVTDNTLCMEESWVTDHDFLDEIKKTETEAALRVEKAQEEAQLQRQMARQHASDIINEAYRSASAIRQEKVSEAEERYRELISDSTSLNVQKPDQVPDQLKAEAATVLAERIVSILEHR